MGDRGNIVMRSTESNRDDVWFYTHWSGSEIKEVAKAALERKARWEDAPYLARMVFDVLTNGRQGQETGFGISASIGDNGHDILVIDQGKQRVFTVPESQIKDGRVPDSYEPAADCVWTFEQFIGAEKVQETV